MLRGSALTARVKSGKRGRGGKTKRHWKIENVSKGPNPLTCDVDVSWGGVQRRRRPGATAVAGSDAFGSGEVLFYFSIHRVR